MRVIACVVTMRARASSILVLIFHSITLCVCAQLPFSVTWQILKDEFSKVGTVTHADVAAYPDGRSKGFGFVTYARSADAETAVCACARSPLCVATLSSVRLLCVCVFAATYTGATMDDRVLTISIE